MLVKVLFFARCRELCDVTGVDLTMEEGSSTPELLEVLLENYPRLSEVLGSCVLSLNKEYLDPDKPAVLRDGDEVALIPPISGG
jgi:MoaE-MoaD fusion protein